MTVKKSVQIRIESRSENEKIVQNVQGELYLKEKNIYIRYQEPEVENMERTMTIVKLMDGEIRIVRQGDLYSEQTYTLNKQVTGTYQTSQGNLETQTFTHHIMVQLKGTQWKAAWSYDLFVGGSSAGKFHITLDVQEVSHS